MNIFLISAALITGSISGYLYGKSFVVRSKKLIAKKQTMQYILTSSSLKLAGIGLISYILLLYGTIHFILFVCAFLIMFWHYLITNQ